MFKKYIKQTLFALTILGVTSVVSSTQTEAYYDENGFWYENEPYVIDVDIPLEVVAKLGSDGKGSTSDYNIVNNNDYRLDILVSSCTVAPTWEVTSYSEDLQSKPINSKYMASKLMGVDILEFKYITPEYGGPFDSITLEDRQTVNFPCDIKITPQLDVLQEKLMDVEFHVEPQVYEIQYDMSKYEHPPLTNQICLSSNNPDIKILDPKDVPIDQRPTGVIGWSLDKNAEKADYRPNQLVPQDTLYALGEEYGITLYPVYLPDTYLICGNDFRKALSGVAEDITDIKFKIDPFVSNEASNAPYKVDLSIEQNNSIRGYMLEGDTTLYIEGSGYINFTEDCSYMFSAYTDDASIPVLSSLTNIDVGNNIISTQRMQNMNYMFYNSKIKAIDMTEFLMSGVKTMDSTYKGCTKLTFLDLSKNYAGNNTTLHETFAGCTSLDTIVLSGAFNANSVVTMEGTYKDCVKLRNLDVSFLNSGSLETLKETFKGCSSLTSLHFGEDFKTPWVKDFSYTFAGCTSLTDLDITKFEFMSAQTLDYTFADCSMLTKIDTSNMNTLAVTSMQGTIKGCASLVEFDVTHLESDQVATITQFAEGCTSLTTLDFSGFNFSLVETADSAFAGCSALTTLKLGDFNAPILNNANAMFKDCSTLTTLLLGTFDAQSLVSGREMFSGCNKLTYLDLGNFKTPVLNDISYMFFNCSGLEVIDFELWDLTKVLANKANSVDTFAGMSGAIGHVAPAQLNNFVTYWGSEAEIKFVPSYSEVPNIKEYYTYSTKFAGYNIGLTAAFKEQLNKAEGGVFTDSLGNTWRTGDPLPNPGSRVNGGSGRKNVEALIDTFGNLTNLVTIDLTKFDTRYNTNFRQLLRGCTSLKEVYMSGLDSSNVTITNDMFENCTLLEKIDLRGMVMNHLPYNSYYQAFENATGVCLVSEEYLQGYLDLTFFNSHVTFTADPSFPKPNAINDSGLSNTIPEDKAEVEEVVPPVVEEEPKVEEVVPPAVEEEPKVEETVPPVVEEEPKVEESIPPTTTSSKEESKTDTNEEGSVLVEEPNQEIETDVPKESEKLDI